MRRCCRYDIGIWGAAHIKVQRRFGLSDFEVSILVGILNLTSAVGGLFCGYISERFGRRKTVAAACVVFIVGSFFKCLAQGYASLMIGRTVTGIGVGVGMVRITPSYYRVTPSCCAVLTRCLRDERPLCSNFLSRSWLVLTRGQTRVQGCTLRSLWICRRSRRYMGRNSRPSGIVGGW